MGSPTSNGLPIHVCELAEGNIVRIGSGERIRTLVTSGSAAS